MTENEPSAENSDEQPSDVRTTSLETVGRRGAIAGIVATLGLAGLTGQAYAQADIGTQSNPYRRLYVSQGVVFVGVTSSSGLPEGALHVRSDLV